MLCDLRPLNGESLEDVVSGSFARLLSAGVAGIDNGCHWGLSLPSKECPNLFLSSTVLVFNVPLEGSSTPSGIGWKCKGSDSCVGSDWTFGLSWGSYISGSCPESSDLTPEICLDKDWLFSVEVGTFILVIAKFVDSCSCLFRFETVSSLASSRCDWTTEVLMSKSELSLPQMLSWCSP